MTTKHPDPTTLLNKAGIHHPIIGVYDAPDPAPFQPVLTPPEGKWACTFGYYENWLQGETLQITPENHGCGGMGTYLCDVSTRSREDYVDFLYGTEGLKASAEIMGKWIDLADHYKPKHGNLFIGPLKDQAYEFLKTATFFVDPDRLSLLITGAYYHHSPDQPPPVHAPFSSGCGQLLPQFEDLDAPAAIIGATDIAMRKYLPSHLMAFTVTRPMYEQLCNLDEGSFLFKPFWKGLRKARES